METVNNKNLNRRRTAGGILAVILIISSLLAGSYTWQALSQEAINETRGTTNPGGRLHDDFDGENKDVYVENFGNVEIYVVVKLSEYMEIGNGAGAKEGVEYDNKDVEKFNPDADINDTSTWSPHVPRTNAPHECDGAHDGKFHNYWQWTMGGQKWYMPTFNKDSDSMKTDVTGQESWVGSAEFESQVTDVRKSVSDGVDYVNLGDGSHDYFMDNNTATGIEYMSDGVNVADVTHQAEETKNATVMTMQQWNSAGMVLGDYWVIDTDGCAYWASPLMPGEATGLLLDKIEMLTIPDDDWYYAIDVKGEFSSASNLWTATGITQGKTDAGKNLLNIIAGDSSSLEFTLNNAITLGEEELKKADSRPGAYTTESIDALRAAIDTAKDLLADIQSQDEKDIKEAIRAINDNIPLVFVDDEYNILINTTSADYDSVRGFSTETNLIDDDQNYSFNLIINGSSVTIFHEASIPLEKIVNGSNFAGYEIEAVDPRFEGNISDGENAGKPYFEIKADPRNDNKMSIFFNWYPTTMSTLLAIIGESSTDTSWQEGDITTGGSAPLMEGSTPVITTTVRLVKTSNGEKIYSEPFKVTIHYTQSLFNY